jgi:hypothetical protein
MSFTNNLEARLLNHIFGGSTSAVPSSLSFGLATNVTEAGVITGEPVGNGYARVVVTNNATNFPTTTLDGTVSVKRNGTSIAFPQATASWGTLTHWFVMDGVNTLAYGALGEAKAIGANDTASFPANSLTIRLD